MAVAWVPTSASALDACWVRESAAASGHASALALGARWERASAAATAMASVAVLDACWARASAAASALVWDSGSAEVLDVASELALHY